MWSPRSIPRAVRCWSRFPSGTSPSTSPTTGAGDRYFSAIADPSQHVQMGYFAWGSDYLAESGFLLPLLCLPTGSDRVCDPTIERRIEQATRTQLTDPAASHDLWSDLEHDLIDHAPW